MWNSTPRVVAQGATRTLEANGAITLRDLRGLLAQGAKLAVPIDSKVSPWPTPKVFTLSQHQAETLLDACEAHNHQLTYIVRTDGVITLIGREHALSNRVGLPDGGPETLPGDQNAAV